MSCPTTITTAPIPGIGDTRVVTLHGLADAQTVIREHAEMARELSALQTDGIWQTADAMRDRAAWAVQSAIKLLTDRDEVLADAVQSARLQADMIERLQDELAGVTAERDKLKAEIERITEAGRVHIRRAAAFESQRDELLVALRCIADEFVPGGGRQTYGPLTDVMDRIRDVSRAAIISAALSAKGE